MGVHLSDLNGLNGTVMTGPTSQMFNDKDMPGSWLPPPRQRPLFQLEQPLSISDRMAPTSQGLVPAE